MKVSAAPKAASTAASATVAEASGQELRPALLPDLLQRLSNGDVTATSATVLSPDYWRSIAGCGSVADASSVTVELPIPESELEGMRSSIRARGYGKIEPKLWQWGEITPALAALREAAATLRAAGWPPAFIFTLDEAWAVLDKLWAPMEAILGPGCAMDPSVFCWIAATPPPCEGSSTSHAQPSMSAASAAASAAPGGSGSSARPAAGANFGVPHRDFTCLQSLRKADGAPAVLSVWLPLSDVTTDNGCMMVVPRQLDRHFLKRFAYAHMRPALPADEDEEEGTMEVRFNLAAARPLAPLCAGSLVAWVGNVIHWGTCCSPDAAAPPRTSIGFNFLAEGERLQSSAPLLTRTTARELLIAGRLALIARSLLAYSPWFSLSDNAVPAVFFPPQSAAMPSEGTEAAHDSKQQPVAAD